MQTFTNRIVVHTTAEVIKPPPERQTDGQFLIVCELSPMASPSFEVSRPTEAETILSRLLEKTIRRSGALDTESLCLLASIAVFSIRCDVHVLSHDGGLVDAACIAVIASLQHFRKCDTSVEGGKVVVYTPAEREPVPLSMLHFPLCVTFSFYSSEMLSSVKDKGEEGEAEEKVLLDATLMEEQMRGGSMTVGMNRHGEICQIAKLGGVPVDPVLLLQCVSIAAVKVKELTQFITARLELDAKKRDKGGLIAGLLSAENDRVS
jgi:exosome complex component RRP45